MLLHFLTYTPPLKIVLYKFSSLFILINNSWYTKSFSLPLYHFYYYSKSHTPILPHLSNKKVRRQSPQTENCELLLRDKTNSISGYYLSPHFYHNKNAAPLMDAKCNGLKIINPIKNSLSRTYIIQYNQSYYKKNYTL